MSVAWLQAWQGRKRQSCGHHLPSSIQDKWLAIDDQKNNMLALLCLAGYLAANWLQKLEMKQCFYDVEDISVLICVGAFTCVCVFGISVWFIYNKIKLPFCKMPVLCPVFLTLLCDVQISHYGSWPWWRR